jgi:hypothetical protein
MLTLHPVWVLVSVIGLSSRRRSQRDTAVARRRLSLPSIGRPLSGVTLGAAAGDLSGARTVIDGFWFGLAKRSIEIP